MFILDKFGTVPYFRDLNATRSINVLFSLSEDCGEAERDQLTAFERSVVEKVNRGVHKNFNGVVWMTSFDNESEITLSSVLEPSRYRENPRKPLSDFIRDLICSGLLVKELWTSMR